MLGNLMDFKKKAEEVQKRLSSIKVEGEAGNNSVKVIMTAEQKVESVSIDKNLLNENEKDQLEELLVVALNRAIESSKNIMKSEMAAVYKGVLPGMF